MSLIYHSTAYSMVYSGWIKANSFLTGPSSGLTNKPLLNSKFAYTASLTYKHFCRSHVQDITFTKFHFSGPLSIQ